MKTQICPLLQKQRTIVGYNGEVCNYKELAGTYGLDLNTKCDTQVVAEMIERYSNKALTDFEGIFAVAYYNKDKHHLILAQDPIGVKPLYYSKVRGY